MHVAQGASVARAERQAALQERLAPVRRPVVAGASLRALGGCLSPLSSSPDGQLPTRLKGSTLRETPPTDLQELSRLLNIKELIADKWKMHTEGKYWTDMAPSGWLASDRIPTGVFDNVTPRPDFKLPLSGNPMHENSPPLQNMLAHLGQCLTNGNHVVVLGDSGGGKTTAALMFQCGNDNTIVVEVAEQATNKHGHHMAHLQAVLREMLWGTELNSPEAVRQAFYQELVARALLYHERSQVEGFSRTSWMLESRSGNVATIEKLVYELKKFELEPETAKFLLRGFTVVVDEAHLLVTPTKFPRPDRRTGKVHHVSALGCCVEAMLDADLPGGWLGTRLNIANAAAIGSRVGKDAAEHKRLFAIGEFAVIEDVKAEVEKVIDLEGIDKARLALLEQFRGRARSTTAFLTAFLVGAHEARLSKAKTKKSKAQVFDAALSAAKTQIVESLQEELNRVLRHDSEKLDDGVLDVWLVALLGEHRCLRRTARSTVVHTRCVKPNGLMELGDNEEASKLVEFEHFFNEPLILEAVSTLGHPKQWFDLAARRILESDFDESDKSNDKLLLALRIVQWTHTRTTVRDFLCKLVGEDQLGRVEAPLLDHFVQVKRFCQGNGEAFVDFLQQPDASEGWFPPQQAGPDLAFVVANKDGVLSGFVFVGARRRSGRNVGDTTGQKDKCKLQGLFASNDEENVDKEGQAQEAQSYAKRMRERVAQIPALPELRILVELPRRTGNLPCVVECEREGGNLCHVCVVVDDRSSGLVGFA